VSKNEDWMTFYKNVKDPSWPDCDHIDDFVKLPTNIQLEILRDHLFDTTKRLVDIDRLIHSFHESYDTDKSQPEFLKKMLFISEVIGMDRCQIELKDVVILYAMVVSKQPKLALEIGRLAGWSTAIISLALKENGAGHLISIDISNILLGVIKHFIDPWATTLVHDSKFLLECKEIKDNKFDFVFIDGDHSYEMVLNDLQKIKEITTPGAWILMHDIDMPPVALAVNDFLADNPEFVDCGNCNEHMKFLIRSK